MVAIEIYVHKHSFLSLQLLTENWCFAISPAQHIVELEASKKKKKKKNVFECGEWQKENGRKIQCESLKGMSNIKDEWTAAFFIICKNNLI